MASGIPSANSGGLNRIRRSGSNQVLRGIKSRRSESCTSFTQEPNPGPRKAQRERGLRGRRQCSKSSTRKGGGAFALRSLRLLLQNQLQSSGLTPPHIGGQSRFDGIALDRGNHTSRTDCQLGGSWRDIDRRGISTGPQNADGGGRTIHSQNLHGGILRPVTRAGMNLPGWPKLLAYKGTKNGADTGRIPRRTSQPDSQSRPGARIAEQFRRAGILGNREISPAVAIVITQRRSALLAINHHPALRPGHRGEAAPPIPSQPQAAAGVVA